MAERPGRDRAVWLGLVFAVLVASATDLRAQSTRRPSRTDRTPARAVEPSDVPSSLADAATAPTPGGLRMSRAVVCKSIDGYENYKPLPGAAQTSDEKLLIYYRPLHYKIDFVDGHYPLIVPIASGLVVIRYKIDSFDAYYQAHLVQDNEIRRRGRKEILRQKEKVVEYNPKSKQPLGPIYIRNTISLKGLQPDEYELTIILRDELDKTAPPTRQLVKFRIIPPHDPRKKQAPEKAEDPSPGR
jgi:hypothetical protein